MSKPTEFEPLTMLQDMADRLALQTRFAAETAMHARQWQVHMRKELASRLGFLNQPVVELEAEVEQEVDRGSYLRRRVVIRTTPHTRMPMYALIPKNAKRPLPCVLALHGHGYGVKDIVGLWEDGSERLEPDGYHKDFGCELAKNGFLVVAPEISCFGERQVQYDLTAPSPHPTTCHHIATFAMMLGGSAAGLRVWDGMRALDYLATLREADVSRIGAMGISGGGMHTFFSTAVDERIKACVISGYFCDFRHSILAMNHCTCNFVPGLLQLGELSDLAGLIAPRPCLVENGSHDEIFPLEHVKPTVEKAHQAWTIFGAAENLETDYFEGRHQISGRKAYAFLREKSGRERD